MVYQLIRSEMRPKPLLCMLLLLPASLFESTYTVNTTEYEGCLNL